MEQISFCGMACNECPAFLATQKNDDDERKKVAEIWSKQYNADIKAENIKCFVRGLNPRLLRRFSMQEYLDFEAQAFMPGRMSLAMDVYQKGKDFFSTAMFVK